MWIVKHIRGDKPKNMHSYDF